MDGLKTLPSSRRCLKCHRSFRPTPERRSYCCSLCWQTSRTNLKRLLAFSRVGAITGVRKIAAASLWHRGCTDHDIASEIGVTRSAVSQWRKREGRERNSRKGRTYAAWHHRVRMLLTMSLDAFAIATMLGKPLKTVQQVIRRIRKVEAA